MSSFNKHSTMNKLFFPFLVLLLSTVASSCKLEDQSETDRMEIEQYLADNKLTATRHESGIYYNISNPGTGANPTLSSVVTVKYKGFLTNDKVFDQSTAGVQFPLSNLIPGWQIAIPLLKKGGSGTFYIPSELGYGSSGQGSIPPNSVLIFNIDLINFY